MLIQRKQLRLLSVGTLILLLIASALAALKNSPAAERRKVFEQTWRAVHEHFYDPAMNGLDWPAVRKTYLRRLSDAENSDELYEKVLNPMLALLESSHVQAVRPTTAALHQLSDLPPASTLSSKVDSCGGITMAFPFRSISAKVASVDTGSFLYQQGVRAKWRVHGWTQAPGEAGIAFNLNFVSTAGETFSFPVRHADHRFPDSSAIKADFKSLGGLLAARVDPSTELRMDSLGMSVVVGQHPVMPVVVDVTNGSVAERAGIAPGSTILRYHRQAIVDDFYSVEAKFISPGGVSTSAVFKFPACEIEDRAAKLLSQGVLYLRFDSFQSSVVAWLDEQLSTSPNAIVLDLRRNSGGRADVLLEVMGRFVGMGTTVGEEIRANRKEVFKASAAPSVFKGPVAVLTTRLSTSAAEVAAGALRFHNRAKLFGTTTRGDVLLANRFQLSDGGVVVVAVADIRTPEGKRLENVGVEPDVEIMPTLETIRAGRDVVLEAALTDLAKTTP